MLKVNQIPVKQGVNDELYQVKSLSIAENRGGVTY